MGNARISHFVVGFGAAHDVRPKNHESHAAWRITWLLKLGVLLLCLGALAPRQVGADTCVIPPTGLISWWRAEGNATDAVGVNSGTLEGGTTFADGEVGQAFSFNGSNSYVQVPDSPSLDFASNGPMTIELWTYRTGAETTMHLIGKQDANCGSLQYQMGFDPYTGLAFTAGNGSVATGNDMPLSTWMHLAATFDGTNTFNFYTNGTLAATGSGNLGAPNFAPLIIGNSSICGGFVGLIDEVSIYDVALSASTIQNIYAAGSAGKCFTPPSIATQPQSQTALMGETVTFSVAATNGITPYTYQWQMNSTNINGATSNTLVLTNVQSNQAGTYSVTVGSAGGSVLSSNATLTVIAPVPGEVVVLDQAGLLSGLAKGGNVTFAGSGIIVLSQTVVISQDTTLDGSGQSVTISGSNSVGVFAVNSGVQFTLKNLTIANGLNGGTNVGTAAGGGVYNDGGTVNVVQCTFIGNAAVGGIAISGVSGVDQGDAAGGAIYNVNGNLNVTNSVFVSNTVTGGAIGNGGSIGGNSYGGAIFSDGTMNLAGSTFLGNSCVGGTEVGTTRSGSAFGGAVWTGGGTSSVIGTTVTGNQCFSGFIAVLSGGGGSSYGGALFTVAGIVTVSNSGFYNNISGSQGIAGGQGEGISVGPSFGGGIYQSSGVLNLSSTVLGTNEAVGGSASDHNEFPGSGNGGGLFNAGTLNATNCAFYSNSAQGGGTGENGADAFGGAVYNQAAAILMDTTLSGNQAVGGVGGTYGGLVYGLPSGTGNGGGIFNSNSLLLLGCTLSQNAAIGQAVPLLIGSGTSGGANAYGGGIYNIGICLATNDTLFGNTANGGSPGYIFGYSDPGGSANGGGLFNLGGTVTLDYLTISSNSAIGGVGGPNGIGVGGGINATNGSLLLLDSIVAENPSGSDFYASFGAITDGGDNISSDISFPFSAPGSLNNTNPEFGLLGNYGGPTQTVPLLAGSPAIDAGGAGGCPATDQRGVPWPVGGACDIGAFEYAQSFSIQGQVQSYGPTGSITVSAGVWSITADSHGNYVLTNVVSGTYSVTPSSSIPGITFTPSSQNISVGPSATNVSFVASLINSLSMEGYSNGILQAAFSGTNGQTTVVEISTNLIDWIPISTNLLDANGILPFLLTNSVGQHGQFIRTRSP